MIPVRSIDSALELWALDLRAAGMRPRTIAIRRGIIRAIHRYAEAGEVGGVTDEQLRAYIGRDGLAVATRRQYATSWRAWCRFSGQECTVVIPRVRPGLPRPARGPQLAAAQLAAPAPVSAWIALGRWAGLRASEVAGVRGEDVDLDAGVLYVEEAKGGQRAAVPLHPRLASLLEPYVEASGGGPLWQATALAVSVRAGKVLRDHGAAERFHQLRHYYGTEIYRASRDLLRAQRALRHRSPATTTIYAQLADDELAAVVAMVP